MSPDILTLGHRFRVKISSWRIRRSTTQLFNQTQIERVFVIQVEYFRTLISSADGLVPKVNLEIVKRSEARVLLHII